MATAAMAVDLNAAPEAIEFDAGHLRLHWPDADAVLNAHALRAACHCATCRSAALRGEPAVFEATVQLTGTEPIGHYALRLHFSDGHERGIYPWRLLRELAAA